MAKNTVLDWDTTAANNTDIGGININEGCAAANMNNMGREMMAQIKAGVATLGGANTFTKTQTWTKGTDVASASALTLGDGNYFDITGTTTITSIATKGVGTVILLQFDAALTLTHQATDLILPGSANITTAAGDHAMFVEYATGDWRCVSYTRASGVAVSQAGEHLRGFINGLTLSNNGTDATNDIDIASGSAGSDGTTPVLMTLVSALTKRLDAAWAVGTGNGGLDTGSIANTTYHVWLIQRSDTGVVDALFSASATSPTMPANYDRKRRIGAIVRESATIVPFTQLGDEFLRKTAILSITAPNPGVSAVTRALHVPTGVQVFAKFNFLVINTASAVAAAPVFTSLDVNDQVPGTIPPAGILASSPAASNSSGNIARSVGEITVRTNTSAQIRSRLEGSDASVTMYISTLGWTDFRGRL